MPIHLYQRARRTIRKLPSRRYVRQEGLPELPVGYQGPLLSYDALLNEMEERLQRASAVTDEELSSLMSAGNALMVRWGVSEGKRSSIFLGEGPPVGGSSRSRTICQLDLLMRIHQGLRRLFSEKERAYAWMRRPNTAFNGDSALNYIFIHGLMGAAVVAAYLETVLDGASSAIDAQGQEDLMQAGAAVPLDPAMLAQAMDGWTSHDG